MFRWIKRFLIGFALIVTISVIIVMAVDPEGSNDKGNKSTDITCIKSSSYDVSTISCADYPCISEYESYIDSISTDSTSWDFQTSTEYLQTFYQTDLGQCIQNINTTCQLRPSPSCYLPENVINYHLSTFLDNGASFITSTKYASLTNFSEFGYEPDDYDKNGVQWIYAYNQETDILKNCGSSECVLTALGIQIGDDDMFNYDWGKPTMINRVIQVKVDKTNLEELNIRMASGNEQGIDSDSEWRVGGYTINGEKEAVVDMIYEGDYCWNGVALPNGTFCYKSCHVFCDNLGGCLQNSCV